MALKDYEHWNEDALYMWWNEEGKHVEEPYQDEWDGMTAAEMDGEDAYYEGQYDAECENPYNPERYSSRALQLSYKQGFDDACASLASGDDEDDE